MKIRIIKDIIAMEPMCSYLDLLGMSLEDVQDLALEITRRKIKSILAGKAR